MAAPVVPPTMPAEAAQPTLAQELLRELHERVERNRRMAGAALAKGDSIQYAFHSGFAEATEWAIRNVTNLRLVEIEAELRYGEALDGIDQYQVESR